MPLPRPINFKHWIDANRHLLRPPVGNKVVYPDNEFIIMVVGGPNARKDFHVDPAEEFFYQLEGKMTLRVVEEQAGKPHIVDLPLLAGDILLLPAGVPHSPQRYADSVGLVVERRRRPGELDGLQWYCEHCERLLYQESFALTDIETQFPPVFDRFFGSLSLRTCKHCHHVMEPPAKALQTMPRNDRAQWARVDIDGVSLLTDLAAGVDLARTIDFSAQDLQCFGAPASSSEPLVVGDFKGAVAQGASCNSARVSITPHANGTHTESVAHLTLERHDAHLVVPQRLLPAVLLTVSPRAAARTPDTSAPNPQPGDLLVTCEDLVRAWPAPLDERLIARAAIIRTLPNGADKFVAPVPQGAPPAPFLSREATQWLVAHGIEHLVLDLPSADRTEDGGALTAHRIFFGLPHTSRALKDAQRPTSTITELAFIADQIPDGWYLLSLQTAAIAGDAVPSRPLLYSLRLV